MNIGVRCFSILRDLAGTSVLELELPDNSRLEDLLLKLTTGPYRRLGNFITNERGGLKPYVKLVRNGELQTPVENEQIHEGDEFHLFVATAGG
jgi:molybdopterin converting factor small subunit